MGWFWSIIDWVVEHWKAWGVATLIGTAGAIVKWWYAIRRERAQARLADIQRNAVELNIKKQKEQAEKQAENEEREKRIAYYVQYFEEEEEKMKEIARVKGKHVGHVVFTSEPKAAPGECQEEVSEAYRRYCKRRRTKPPFSS